MMIHPLAPGSQSSDLFDSDPAFLQALEDLEIPGEVDVDVGPSRPATVKRVHSPDNEQEYMNSNTYGASSFGGFGQYMARKRAKLQVQNSTLNESDASNIFRGLAIYINGFTRPSVQDLRELIIRRGGVFHAYLDKKGLVTHIITCSLTPAKIREFKHMKVVRPEWLVESDKAGILLPWQDFIFRADERVLESDSKKTAQKPLFHSTTSNKPDQSDIYDNDGANYIIDPVTMEQAAPIPGYAADKSNPNAERAMADPEWRKQHTSAAPGFIEGFYKNSRLHHLSTWKTELKKLVQEAQDRAELSFPYNNPSTSGDKTLSMKGAELVRKLPSRKGKEKAIDYERVVMHCDFDSFFVSAGLADRGHLRGKPVVVCHSQGNQGGQSSTSEIASASYEARKFGIKNGMSLQQARKLCPDVQTIPYEFQRYRDLSLKFYTILMAHADDLEAVSVDEALIEVTDTLKDTNKLPKEYAEIIRDRIRQETGCEVSIGISHNIMLARLATKKAKPAGSFHLISEDLRDFLEPLDIKDLHGFGYSLRQKAEEKLGVTQLGALSKKSKNVLCDALGKGTGEKLFNVLRGIDDQKLVSDKPRKSVSCDVNYGIRFQDNAEVEEFISTLSKEVSKRLEEEDLRGKSITLKIMKRDPNAPVEAPKFLGHGLCETFNRQTALVGSGGQATNDAKTIAEYAWRLLRSFEFDPKELRGISIQIQKLEKNSGSIQDAGQGLLPFKAKQKPKLDVPQVVIHPPTSSPSPSQVDPADERIINVDKDKGERLTSAPAKAEVDIPSFSQIDMSVYNMLPEEIQQELAAEYQRRPVSPVPGPSHDPSSTSALGRHSEPPVSKFGPRTAMSSKLSSSTNKLIVHQPAPKLRAPVPQDPPKFLRKRPGPSNDELRALNIDPEVFAWLPAGVKLEQLAGARLAKTTGILPVARKEPRVILKPVKRKQKSEFIHKPFPKAKYIEPLALRQQGKTKGEKLAFTETGDIQAAIEKWVENFREHPPNQRDVDYFGKFLVGCVDSVISGDIGVEKAVKVAKWWLYLLRKHWAEWEKVDIEEIVVIQRDAHGRWGTEMVGRAWWRAFRGVKKQMDSSMRKKFGGRLSLR